MGLNSYWIDVDCESKYVILLQIIWWNHCRNFSRQEESIMREEGERMELVEQVETFQQLETNVGPSQQG